jgi:hypothetical protein
MSEGRINEPTFSLSSDKFQAHQFLMLIDGLGSDQLMPAFSVWKKQWSFAFLLIRLQIGRT